MQEETKKNIAGNISILIFESHRTLVAIQGMMKVNQNLILKQIHMKLK